MDKRSTRAGDETPTKPSSKKPKLNEVHDSNGNMDCDAPGSSSTGTSPAAPPGAVAADNPRRSLLLSPTSELADEAPNWFVSFFTAFEKRFEQKIDCILVKRLNELSMKINEQEEKLTCLEIDVENMQKEVTSLKEENSSLRIAVDDLENRSRRQNLVFHGIPDGGEGEDCRRTVDTILQEFVGLSPSTYTMERVHRTPTTMQQRSQARDPQQSQRGNTRNAKPRMIHVCFSTFSQKEKVKTEYLKKFKAQEYDGHKLYVAEDLSKRVRS